MFPASSSELRELHNALRANISYHMVKLRRDIFLIKQSIELTCFTISPFTIKDSYKKSLVGLVLFLRGFFLALLWNDPSKYCLFQTLTKTLLSFLKTVTHRGLKFLPNISQLYGYIKMRNSDTLAKP